MDGISHIQTEYAYKLEQSTTFTPFVRQFITLSQVACGAGQYNIIYIISRALIGSRYRNGMFKMVNVSSIFLFKLSMTASRIVAPIALGLQFGLNLNWCQSPFNRFHSCISRVSIDFHLIGVGLGILTRIGIKLVAMGFSVNPIRSIYLLFVNLYILLPSQTTLFSMLLIPLFTFKAHYFLMGCMILSLPCIAILAMLLTILLPAISMSSFVLSILHIAARFASWTKPIFHLLVPRKKVRGCWKDLPASSTPLMPFRDRLFQLNGLLHRFNAGLTAWGKSITLLIMRLEELLSRREFFPTSIASLKGNDLVIQDLNCLSLSCLVLWCCQGSKATAFSRGLITPSLDNFFSIYSFSLPEKRQWKGGF